MKVKLKIVFIIIAVLFLSGFLLWFYQNFTLNDLNRFGNLFGISQLGTTLTAITGTTKIKDLGTILPANFNALNSDKIETSTTTLPKITSLPGLTIAAALSITKSQVSDFGSYDVIGQATSTVNNIYYYPSFSFPAANQTATTTVATTTVPLGVAMVGETWSEIACFSFVGQISYEVTDGTNAMNTRQASTTASRFALTTNNTFVANEKRYISIGPMTKDILSCSITKKY